MAEAVRKLERVASAPDGSKPIKLAWWKTPQMIGVRIDTMLQAPTEGKEGGVWSDGCGTTGYIESLTLHPGGNVVVELKCGWDPTVLASEQKFVTKYAVVYGGHGMALAAEAQ